MTAERTIVEVSDIGFEQVLGTSYDFAVFASGYETRSIYVPSQIDPSRVRRPFILGFNELREELARPANDAFYRREWSSATSGSASSNEDAILYEWLRQFGRVTDEVRILVDYSSMSRIWYNALLNLVRYAPGVSSVLVDFTYSRGHYASAHHPLIITDILFLPGCESAPQLDRKTLAVFGLGFDGIVALSAYDRLEPDEVLAHLASPGSNIGDEEKAVQANQTFIDQYVTRLSKLPINSVATAVWHLRELIAPDLMRKNVLMVPIGPKPHVLAALLVSRMHERYVGCLRVGGTRHPPVDVAPTGEVVATRVHFDCDTLSDEKTEN